MAEEYSNLMTTAPSISPRSVGRPSYEQEDAPLCAKLVQETKAGDFRSIEAAARANWRLAVGYGSSDSKVDRVAKRARALQREGLE